MNPKILLILIAAASLSSCSTAYKSGQTPDDVYYSPVKPVEERHDNDRKKEETRPDENTTYNNRIRMTIRDRRWRDFDNDYDYSYDNSPYRYSYSSYNSYGYYYNPVYYSKPVYYCRFTPTAPVNTTPRMVNLNSYKNYSAAAINNIKTGNSYSTSSGTRQYNNSNNNGSRLGNLLRQVITPAPSSNTNTNNSSNNNTRTYTPSTNSSSSSSSGSSGGSSSGGSVSRPGRG